MRSDSTDRAAGLRGGKRWVIAIAGTALQLCLGTVYAWSYFQKPLMEAYGWSNAQVAWTFSLAICCLGLAAAWGGLQLPRLGPRRLAMLGGALFGTGHLVAALALRERSLTLLYLGYGVLGGCGLGLGYVTPVATVAKWFPDKKGLATGMVIMGFGLGAFLMSKVFAPLVYRASGEDLVAVFAWLGIGFLLAVVGLGAMLRNPPVAGCAIAAAERSSSAGGRALPDLFSRRFGVMWLVFFANILPGISLISFQSPLFQELWHARDPDLSKDALAAYGATLIAVTSLLNGAGRMFWGGLSDRIGRERAFQIMLGSQIVACGVMTQVGNPWLFGGLMCYILLCYGGGFGTMPSFVLDVFGPAKMAVVYGAILTAWSAGGIAGPQLVALLKDRYAEHAAQYAFLCNATVLALGFALAVACLRTKQPREADGQSQYPDRPNDASSSHEVARTVGFERQSSDGPECSTLVPYALRIVHVGYHPTELGGVSQVTETLRPFFPGMIYHSAVRRTGNRWQMLLFCLTAYLKYAGILLRRRPRVVQVVVASPADQVRMLPYVFLSRLWGMRVVLAFHYDVLPAYRSLPPVLRWLVRRGYAAAQQRCFLTEIFRRDFENLLAPLSGVVIPNPLSPQFADVARLPYEERDNCVVYLGRFQREKGLFDLLETAKRSAELKRPVEYHFWGDGVRPRQVPPNCVFHGWISGAAKVEMIRKARLLILPSHAEAFGLAALEAMACGTPAVVTRVGGLPEVIQDGIQGRVVAPGNPAELLAAVDSLIEDRDLWEECSRRGRETAPRYAASEIAAQWRELYRGL